MVGFLKKFFLFLIGFFVLVFPFSSVFAYYNLDFYDMKYESFKKDKLKQFYQLVTKAKIIPGLSFNMTNEQMKVLLGNKAYSKIIEDRQVFVYFLSEKSICKKALVLLFKQGHLKFIMYKDLEGRFKNIKVSDIVKCFGEPTFNNLSDNKNVLGYVSSKIGKKASFTLVNKKLDSFCIGFCKEGDWNIYSQDAYLAYEDAYKEFLQW